MAEWLEKGCLGPHCEEDQFFQLYSWGSRAPLAPAFFSALGPACRASLGAQVSSGAWRSFASLRCWSNPQDGSWAKSSPVLLARRCKAEFQAAMRGKQTPPKDLQGLLRYIRPSYILPQEEESLWLCPTKTSGSNLPGPETPSARAELGAGHGGLAPHAGSPVSWSSHASPVSAVWKALTYLLQARLGAWGS